MSKRKIDAAMEKVRKGVALQQDGFFDMDKVLTEMFGATLVDLVEGHAEREDSVFDERVMDAAAETIMEWGREYAAQNEDSD